MTDPDSTTVQHFRDLVLHVQEWIRTQMDGGNFKGAFEMTSELEWLANRAGVLAEAPRKKNEKRKETNEPSDCAGAPNPAGSGSRVNIPG